MKASLRFEKAASIVGPMCGLWTEPPRRVPFDHQVDGPLLGNGDFGAVVGGAEGEARWHLSKVDFWESRYPFPSGGPRPLGVVRVTGPVGGWAARENLYTADVICELGPKDAARTVITSYVSARENLLILTLTAVDGAVDGTVALLPHPGTGGPRDRSVTESGSTDFSRTLYRGYVDEGVEYTSQVMTAMSLLPRKIAERTVLSQEFGGAPSLTPLEEEIPYALAEGETMTLVVCAVTNHDAAAYRVMAVEKAESVEEADLPMLRRLHEKWWQDFYAKAYVEFDDPLLMKYYYSSFYNLASCSRNGKFPPGLIGLWITTDMPAWASDFHFNYNHEAPWWACYTGNHIELTEGYERPMLEYVPRARVNARKYEGCRGIYFDVGIGPMGFASSAEPNPYEDNHYFLGQKSNACFIVTNMIMRWKKTRDVEYAAKVYSFIKDAVMFYRDFVDDEDGVLHLTNDAPGEISTYSWRLAPPNRRDMMQFRSKDNLVSLALLKYAIPALCEISEELGVDAALRPEWEDLAARLAPYPTSIGKDGKEYFMGCGDNGWWNAKRGICSALHMTMPCGLTGSAADTRLRQIAQDSFAATVDSMWFHFNMFCMTYPTAARLNYDPERILEEMRGQCAEHGFNNLWTYHGGGGIEDLSAVPNTLQEMLLQSYEGFISLIPNWPAGKAASFAGWLADGGFEVDAVYDGEKVTELVITSHAGNELKVKNPWPDQEVMIQSGLQQMVLSGEMLQIDTEAGEVLTFQTI